MSDTNKRNTPHNILSAWTAMEVLSPQMFNSPEELVGNDVKRIISLAEVDRLPWEVPVYVPANNTLYYQVILGTINMKAAVSKLCEVYGDDRIEQPNIKNASILATVVVDKTGRIVSTPYPLVAVSSFAWGVPKAIKRELQELRTWNLVERKIAENLYDLLLSDTKLDLILNRSNLDKAYDHLVTEFDLDKDFVKKKQFAIETFMLGKDADPPEPLLFNSFFLNDLAYADRLFSTKKATTNLKKYLGVEVPQERHNLLEDNVALEKALAPDLTPPARWPGAGRHPLILLQQAAVNLAIHELKDDGILAINGPPGTGKTTLLRDIVAALVTQRAEVMCSYEDPEQAFISSAQELKISERRVKLYQLDDKLKGFEMLIASANNKAVENITAELPTSKAIAQDITFKYFPMLSDALLDRSSFLSGAPLQRSCWGLIAAVLGNASNRNSFCRIFWGDKDVGLSTYLAEVAGIEQWFYVKDKKTKEIIEKRKPKIIQEEQPPVSHEKALQKWCRAQHEFQKVLRASKYELDKLEEVRQQVKTRLQTILDIKKDLKGVISDRDEAVGKLETTKMKLCFRKEDLQEAESCFSEHQATKPQGIKVLNFGRVRLWNKQDEVLQARIVETKKLYEDQEIQVKSIEDELAELELSVQEVERQLQAAHRSYNRIKEKVMEGDTDPSKHFISEEFFALPHESKHQVSPWCEARIHQLRDEVFIAAMKVHRAFVDAAARRLRHNLEALTQVLKGGRALDEKRHLLPDLWSSLFLVVPAVSTAFASAERMLSSLPPESLGWLLIDEAGQASPQAAIGAISRTKRAVIVGDPIQIEPVVALPEILTKGICKVFNIDSNRFNAPEVSVQILADAATSYYAELGDREVGIPLLVHRRCADPMFSISNKIGYNGLMIQAKQKGNSEVSKCLGPSAWIDVRGQAEGNWCPEEGRKVVELLKMLWLQRIKPDLYIITPFVVVRDNLRKEIRKHLGGWVDESWIKERVGTIHTAQGREAEAVIFVLGATAANQKGARNWAGKKANLLNVAVTRAKEALYIVGNYNLWSNEGVFSIAAQLVAAPQTFPETVS